MAWITERETKAGRRVYVVHWRDQDGRHRSKSAGGRKSTADALARQVEAAKGRTEQPPPGDPMAALEDFLADKALHLAAESVASYRRHLHPMFEGWAPVPLKEWTPQMAKHYLREKKAQQPRPWSSTMHRLWLHSCRAFVKWARAEGVVAADFTEGLEYPRKEQTVPRYLPLDDLARLLKAARDHRLEVLIGLCALAGMRPSEARAAQVEDIDYRREDVKVRGVKKGRERLVPLDASLREILERRAPPAGKLVQHGYHHPAHYKALKGLCAKAGVPYLGFHGLRHSYATAVLDAGGTVAELRDLLGHRNLETTSRYLHSQERGRKAAVAAFGERLRAQG